MASETTSLETSREAVQFPLTIIYNNFFFFFFEKEGLSLLTPLRKLSGLTSNP